MRIVLKKGKQRELIELAKKDLTWMELAEKINCVYSYLASELRYEKRYLSEEAYKKLCTLAKVNFNEFILAKKDNNWGRVKGGTNSEGNPKTFIEPSESKELAELFGIILGDGHVEWIVQGKKIRSYSVVIAGDSRNDKVYLETYVSLLFNRLFGEFGTMRFAKQSNSVFLRIHGKKLVEFINKKGIKSGNKKNNHQKIPSWILKNKEYLRACVRGLIDADGCIYYISKKTNRNLRISFTSYIPALMNDVRNALIKLGFHPSKIIRDKDICLSSKEDVGKFMKDIGFSNDKHLKRLQNLTNKAPIV